MIVSAPAEPDRDCALCPRLVAYRRANRAAHPDWWNGPAPSFGAPSGRLYVIGLAPGLKGANRTGRPFTGDAAGDVLYPALTRFGFGRGDYAARVDDGFELVDCLVTNAVRCAPPQNKPTGPEIAACNPHLVARLSEAPRLRAILALGRIAHDAVLRACGARLTTHPFAHGAVTPLDLPGGRKVTLADSYHCSRYNLNTRRLTVAMFDEVLAGLRRLLDKD